MSWDLEIIQHFTETTFRISDIPQQERKEVELFDMKKAMKVANKLECGGVVINGASFHRSFEMPFGGYKFSGIGTEGVMSTFDAMTRTKTITLKNIIK